MSHWDYRIVRDKEVINGEDHIFYTIREVYYDDLRRIKSWSREPSYALGETWVECADSHSKMNRAMGMMIVDVTSGKPVEISPLRKGR